jgi:hypothetical protein
MAERGFQVILQSVRGTFGSGGVFEPMRNEREDGLATLEWVVKQPWFGDSIVLVGPSYLGYVQWAVAHRFKASRAPPRAAWRRPTSPSTTTPRTPRRPPSRPGRPGRGSEARAGGPRSDLPDRLALLGLEHVLGPARRPVARQGQLVAITESALESRADRLH